VSRRKSVAYVSFNTGGALSGTTMRGGNRFFVRRTAFNFSAQYTRYTRLWFQVCPNDRRRSKHFQKPQRHSSAMMAVSAAMIGASASTEARGAVERGP
jgi:hypothetical protein